MQMKRNCMLSGLTLLLLLSSVTISFSATLYWVGPAGGAFSGLNNWSTTSGGTPTGTGIASVDIAVFDGGASRSCSLTGATSIAGITILSGYTQTLSTNNFSLTVGTGGISIGGGTFSAGTSAISISGGFTLSGSGVYTSGSNTVTFNPANSNTTTPLTISITGNPSFNNLTFTPTGAGIVIFDIVNSPVVSNLFTLSGSTRTEINTGTMNITGGITCTSTAAHTTGGTGTLRLTGNTNRTFTGGASISTSILPNITIERSGGTLTLAGTIATSGNWNYISGTVAPGSSTVAFTHQPSTGSNVTIKAVGTSTSMNFNNLTIRSSGTGGSLDCRPTSSVTINGAFLISPDSRFNLNGQNLTVNGNWTNNGTWTQPSGTLIFGGSGTNTVTSSAATISLVNMTVNKSAVQAVSLGKAVTITGLLTLTNGLINTTSNLLTLSSTSSVAGGSNNSYVNGPMQKQGTSAFIFPLGKSTVSGTPYHPLAISAPATSSNFTAEYFGTAQTSGTAKVASIATLNNCEYWTIQRNSGTATVTVTPNWNGNCNISNYSELVVAAWNGTQWTDLGAGTLNASTPQGSLQSSSSVAFSGTTVVPLMLAQRVVNISFASASQQLTSGYYNTNGNVLWFRYDEQYLDANSILNYRIVRLSDNAVVTLMSNSTTSNIPVVPGMNQYKMDLYTAGNTPLAAGMYLLEITNDKNEVFVIRFNKTN
ncbi:MAG: hypothetical protein MUC87_22240 [Bacteroidia bacterium]|jgi:hypothetical protein|nr:hypothetical protein [Bacteroidia bacterium]